MRRSRQLLPRAEMNTGGRRLPLDVLAVADPEGTRLPTSILMLGQLVLLVLTVELHAARPSPTRKRGVRYAALSELPVHEALLLHTRSASRALEHIASHILGAHVLISTVVAVLSRSRGINFAALCTPPIGRVALHYRLGMVQRTHGAHLRTVLRYCSRVIVSVSVRVMLGSIELCCRGSTGFSTVV